MKLAVSNGSVPAGSLSEAEGKNVGTLAGVAMDAGPQCLPAKGAVFK
ncbi:MAG: hypothetical protein LC776_15845 [Acidobacteria bacterium]|nr:hypothetical protein [Acidobacteriota bacterium]